jgi:hypothetical protein
VVRQAERMMGLNFYPAAVVSVHIKVGRLEFQLMREWIEASFIVLKAVVTMNI